MMPNDFPITPSYIVNRDLGDENTPLACDTCGSTEQPLSVNSMSNELNPGQVSCGRCIFDRGNAAALRLATVTLNVEARRVAGADGWSV